MLSRPSLMGKSKAGATLIGAPFRCSTLGFAPGLSCKHETTVDRLTTDKQSSLFGSFINYAHKRLIAFALHAVVQVCCMNMYVVCDFCQEFGSLHKEKS
jgi:hypothetical protein